MPNPSAHPETEETLRALLRLDRLQAIRDLLLYILAFDGAVVWLDIVWPRLLHRMVGSFAALMWPVCFAFFAIVLILERRAKARADRLAEVTYRSPL